MTPSNRHCGPCSTTFVDITEGRGMSRIRSTPCFPVGSLLLLLDGLEELTWLSCRSVR